jgi:hypothetical protein
MKWILLPIAILILAGAVMWRIGARLPPGHVAARRARYRQKPEALWRTLTEVEAYPAWRPDLQRVERLPDRKGCPAWIEQGRLGRITYERVADEAPRRVVHRIADPRLPFGGEWIFEIEPATGGSIVKLTENGEVHNPIFRFLSRYVFGHEVALDAYLRSLGRKYNEDTQPEPAN